MNAVGQIGQHQAEKKAVGYRNRAKLKNFDAANEQYLTEVMLDNAKWKNDVQAQEVEQDQLYRAMVDQWVEDDQQLDKIFADADNKVEAAIIKMYENDYAGTGTGRTAARLAGSGAKKLGQEKSRILNQLMLAKDEAYVRGESVRNRAITDSNRLFEKVRFSPIHGPTPIAPELEAKPSTSSLILGLAASAAMSYGASKLFKAPGMGKGTGDAAKVVSDQANQTTVGALQQNIVEQSGGVLTENLQGALGMEIAQGQVGGAVVGSGSTAKAITTLNTGMTAATDSYLLDAPNKLNIGTPNLLETINWGPE